MSSGSINRHLWRETESSPKLVSRKPGVSPKSFYKLDKNGKRPQQSKRLEKILHKSASNVIREQRKQISIQIKLRRAAFKEVTSLKTWPLQDQALRDLDHWLRIHSGNHSLEREDPDLSDVETHGDSTGLSSSSLEEPKRARRKGSDDEDDLSPRKSTQRNQFKLDFCKERNLKPAPSVENEGNFQPALWCMEPRIFSVEKNKTGKRKYVVGHLGRFLDYYWRKCDPKQRHYYELIREKTPCRLYFDLEFSKETNPCIDDEQGEALMNDFIFELIDEFDNLYNINISRTNIIDLDSSTSKKFSRHLVIHLPNGELFADTAAVGRFVRVFVGRLADEVVTNNLSKRSLLAKYLFVTPPRSKSEQTTEAKFRSKTCFVDLGVYTRNRLFRILGSCKFGKPVDASLRISSTNQFKFPAGFCNESFYVPALKRAAEQKRNDAEELDEDMSGFMSAVDFTSHAEALAATLVIPMNATKQLVTILDDSEPAQALEVLKGISELSCRSKGLSANQTSPTVRSGKSSFSGLDGYVLNVLAVRGGVEGALRAWSVECEGGVPISITYQITRNRWCECIGRSHKSNNIMWTIDFSTMEATQGCHDPECRALRFRGNPVALPQPIVEELRDALFEYELANLDESQVLSKKRSPKPQSEFDDEAFEQALLALKINGDDTPRKANLALQPGQDYFDSTV